MADDIQSQIKKASEAPVKKKSASSEGNILHKQLANIEQEMAEKGIAREAKEKGENYISLSTVPLQMDVLHLLTRDEIMSSKVVPFHKVGNELHIAMLDPLTSEAKKVFEKLQAQGFVLKPFLCSKQGIERALASYDIGDTGKKIVLEKSLAQEMISKEGTIGVDFEALKKKILIVSAAEALQLIHIAAMQVKSSDIHIQPTEGKAIVRFRMDGILKTVFEIPAQRFDEIAVQIKHNAGVKINVKNIPQDGEYSFDYEDRSVRVRMSTLPTEYGESIVFRLLDATLALTTFDALGFEQGNLFDFQKALRISYGMVLVTGPTGSGKTTTLYTALRSMASTENKVITLEDPMEYAFPDIVQSQVHPDAGYTFDQGLRAILRQDPDIIMIGEIRDYTSAETATQAALTGHTVLSTLHTNSALEAITRLLNMGVKPFVLAPALHTILGQRLVRLLCPHCKKEREISASEKQEIESALPRILRVRPDSGASVPTKVFDKVGCDSCHHSGYMGRTAITEVLVIDDEIRALIVSMASSDMIAKKILNERPMLLMKEDGILKTINGVTTLSEVLRVIGS